MMGKFGNFKVILKRNKRDIVIILAWAVAISLLIIKTHQIFYIENEMFQTYRIPFLIYEGPRFSGLDLLLLFIIGLFAGIFLIETKSLVYGYFGSMILSIGISVTYVFLFIWYSLDLGRAFIEIPFGWEWAFFQALVNILRFMFPLGLIFSLIGMVLGSVLKNFLSF